MRPITFGVHGSANLGDLKRKDLEILKYVAPRVQGYKFLTGHSVSHYRAVIVDAGIPANQCMTRLYMDMRGRERKPSPAEFVHDMDGAISDALNHGVRCFELHNEPNLYDEWKPTWGGAAGFTDWALEIVHQLRQRFPSIILISPGLWPSDHGLPGIGESTDSWIDVMQQRGLFRACDITGAHAYWGKRSGLNDFADGLNYARYIPHTTKPIWVTEFSNNQTSDSDFEKGRQYRDYLNHLRLHSGVVNRAYCFVLSGSGFDSSRETWDRGEYRAGIPGGVMS